MTRQETFVPCGYHSIGFRVCLGASTWQRCTDANSCSPLHLGQYPSRLRGATYTCLSALNTPRTEIFLAVLQTQLISAQGGILNFFCCLHPPFPLSSRYPPSPSLRFRSTSPLRTADSPGSDLEDELEVEDEDEEEAMTFNRSARANGANGPSPVGVEGQGGGGEGGGGRKKRRMAVHDDEEEEEEEQGGNDKRDHTNSSSSGDEGGKSKGFSSCKSHGMQPAAGVERESERSQGGSETVYGTTEFHGGVGKDPTAAMSPLPPTPAAVVDKSLGQSKARKATEARQPASVAANAVEACNRDASAKQQPAAAGDKQDYSSARKEAQKAGKQQSRSGAMKHAKNGNDQVSSPEVQEGNCEEVSEKAESDKVRERVAGKRHSAGAGGKKEQRKKRAVMELQEQGEGGEEGARAAGAAAAASDAVTLYGNGHCRGPEKTGGGSEGRKKQKLVWQTDVDEKGREGEALQ